MKRRTQKRRYEGRPIILANSTDHYTLGIICAKLSIIESTKKNFSVLRRQTDELRLFRKGIADSYSIPFSDIGYDLFLIREETKERFDAGVLKYAGPEVLAEVKKAIAGAEDWETDEQKEIGLQMLTLINQPKPDEDRSDSYEEEY